VAVKSKRRGAGLEFRTFNGRSGQVYTVLRTLDGSYHVLVEVEAKQAAHDCGATGTSVHVAAWRNRRAVARLLRTDEVAKLGKRALLQCFDFDLARCHRVLDALDLPIE
jgi:hypothetical protein